MHHGWLWLLTACSCGISRTRKHVTLLTFASFARTLLFLIFYILHNEHVCMALVCACTSFGQWTLGKGTNKTKRCCCCFCCCFFSLFKAHHLPGDGCRGARYDGCNGAPSFVTPNDEARPRMDSHTSRWAKCTFLFFFCFSYCITTRMVPHTLLRALLSDACNLSQSHVRNIQN